MKGRAALIKMLGNAVVPQWALVLLAAIGEIEGMARINAPDRLHPGWKGQQS